MDTKSTVGWSSEEDSWRTDRPLSRALRTLRPGVTEEEVDATAAAADVEATGKEGMPGKVRLDITEVSETFGRLLTRICNDPPGVTDDVDDEEASDVSTEGVMGVVVEEEGTKDLEEEAPPPAGGESY